MTDPFADLVPKGKANPKDKGTWRVLADFAQTHGFDHGEGFARGGHNKGSLHYSGEALDIRIGGKTPAQVEDFMRKAAAAGFNVRDERTHPAGQAVWGGPHVHLSLKGASLAESGGDDPFADLVPGSAPKSHGNPKEPYSPTPKTKGNAFAGSKAKAPPMSTDLGIGFGVVPDAGQDYRPGSRNPLPPDIAGGPRQGTDPQEWIHAVANDKESEDDTTRAMRRQGADATAIADYKHSKANQARQMAESGKFRPASVEKVKRNAARMTETLADHIAAGVATVLPSTALGPGKKGVAGHLGGALAAFIMNPVDVAGDAYIAGGLSPDATGKDRLGALANVILKTGLGEAGAAKAIPHVPGLNKIGPAIEKGGGRLLDVLKRAIGHEEAAAVPKPQFDISPGHPKSEPPPTAASGDEWQQVVDRHETELIKRDGRQGLESAVKWNGAKFEPAHASDKLAADLADAYNARDAAYAREDAAGIAGHQHSQETLKGPLTEQDLHEVMQELQARQYLPETGSKPVDNEDILHAFFSKAVSRGRIDGRGIDTLDDLARTSDGRALMQQAKLFIQDIGSQSKELPRLPKPHEGETAVPVVAKSETGPTAGTREEGTTIASKNASTADVRKRFGLDELPKAEKEAWGTTLANAKGTTDGEIARANVQGILDGTKKVLTNDEQAGVLLHLDERDLRFQQLTDEAATTTDPARLEAIRAEKARIQADVEDATQALKTSGTETARTLANRRGLADPTKSLPTYLAEVKSQKGRALTDKETAKFTKLYEDAQKQNAVHESTIADLTSQIEDLKAGKPVAEAAKRAPRFSQQSLDAELEDLLKQGKEVLTRLGSGVDKAELIPIAGKIAINYAKRGINTLEEVVAKVIEHFPDLTRQEVIDGIAANTAQRPRSEVAKSLAGLKAEAKKLSSTGQAEAIAKAEQKAAQKAVADAERNLKSLVNAEQKRILSERDQAIKIRREAVLKDAKAKLTTADKAVSDAMREAVEPLQRLDRVNAEIADLTEQLKTGATREKTAKVIKAKTRELELAQAKRDLLKSQVRQSVGNSKPKSISDYLVNIVNAPKGLRASLDLSAGGRQGWLAGAADPMSLLRGTKKELIAMKTPEDAMRLHTQLLNRQNAPLYKKGGVAIMPLDHGLDVGEEAFTGTSLFKKWKKLNPFTASERGYVTILNHMRADMFDQLHAITKWMRSGRDLSDADLKILGNAVNVFTGRGGKSLEPLGFAKASEFLGHLGFSPKFVASRFEFLAGQPIFTLQKGGAAARVAVAQHYVRAAASVGAASYLLYQWAKQLWPNEVSFGSDPASTDYGKLKIGNAKIDLGAGALQPLVLSYREATGNYTSHGGKHSDLRNAKYGGATGSDVAFRFARSKASPIAGAALNLADAKDYIGRPYGVKDLPGDLLAPLSAQETISGVMKDGWSRDDALALLNFLGISVQVEDPVKIKD